MRAMEALIKQYAPSEDDAWNWARAALGMGWIWDEHVYMSDSGAKRVALSFRSRQHLGLIGVCLVAGAVRWAWFSDEEWGARGKRKVLDGAKTTYPDPISCIAATVVAGDADRGQGQAPRSQAPAAQAVKKVTPSGPQPPVEPGDTSDVFGTGWEF